VTSLFIMLAIASAWLTAGTITFRRTGAYAVESSKTYHSYECRRKGLHCQECGHRKYDIDGDKPSMSNHDEHCSSYPYTSSYRYKDKADINKKPVYTKKCTCYAFNDKWLRLVPIALLTYTLWPVLWVVYGGCNAQKAYVLHKGEDWNFFVKPKMVQSREEKDADFSKRMDEIKKVTKKLELEIGLKETSDES
jgi:hypothetical protein